MSIQPVVPDYDLLRRIGGGAYGDVWLARSRATGALRAAKIVWRHRFEDNRPFEREFKGIQKFERISREHPSQLALFHIGRNDSEGYFYYVMELADRLSERSDGVVEGRSSAAAGTLEPQHSITPTLQDPGAYEPHTLRADLEQGRLPASKILEIGLALAEALGHLHRHGLVHRDVKPSNVIFVNGRPKLADIGLVTDASDQCSIVGTEGYLPPEGPGTPQADIFALGKVLYEAATGLDRRRFPDLPADLKEWPERNALLELNPILLKACASDTRQRYASAQQIEADLSSLRQGKSIRRQFQWRKRVATVRKAGLAILAFGGAAVACFALWNQYANRYDVSANAEVNDLVQQGFLAAKSEIPERLNQAEKDFEKAIKLDPTFVPAHWGLFSVAIAREEWLWNASPQAHQHIRGLAAKLKSIAPNRAESHTAAATIKWQDWKFAEALAEDRAATQARAACRDGRAAALCMYGFHLVQTGHPEEALAEYLMAERIDPTFPTIQHHLGHPYFVRRQFEEALAHYQKSIDLEPRHWLGYHWKGRVYEEKGDFTNAIAAFEEVERLKNPMVKTNGFYETLGEAVRQAPEHPAQAYWGKRLELALRHSTDPRYFYDIATFYARMGDRTNAYSYLKQACEKRAFSQGPLFDACWDKSDTNFQEIVRGIGLSVPVPR